MQQAIGMEINIQVEGRDRDSLARALRTALEELDSYKPEIKNYEVISSTPFCGGAGGIFNYEVVVKSKPVSEQLLKSIEARKRAIASM